MPIEQRSEEVIRPSSQAAHFAPGLYTAFFTSWKEIDGSLSLEVGNGMSRFSVKAKLVMGFNSHYSPMQKTQTREREFEEQIRSLNYPKQWFTLSLCTEITCMAFKYRSWVPPSKVRLIILHTIHFGSS